MNQIMRSVGIIVLHAFAASASSMASSKNLALNHHSYAGQRHGLFDRMRSASLLQHADLDQAVLGKPGHLTISAPSSLRLVHPLAAQTHSIPRVNPALPLPARPYSSSGDSFSASTGHRAKIHAAATFSSSHWKKERERIYLEEELRDELCPTLRYKVALTRARGENEQLRTLLEDLKCDIECVELPCTEVVKGDDDKMPSRTSHTVAKLTSWTKDENEEAHKVDVVAFSSPIAVRFWAEHVGTNYTAVAIGHKAAEEAEKKGFKQVVAPGSPEVEALADVIRTTVEEFDKETEEVYLGLHG